MPSPIRSSFSPSMRIIPEIDEEAAEAGHNLVQMDSNEFSESFTSDGASSTANPPSTARLSSSPDGSSLVTPYHSGGSTLSRADSPPGNYTKEIIAKGIEIVNSNPAFNPRVFKCVAFPSPTHTIDAFPLPPGFSSDPIATGPAQAVPNRHSSVHFQSYNHSNDHSGLEVGAQDEVADRYDTPTVFWTRNRCKKWSIYTAVSILVLGGVIVGILAGVSKGTFGKKPEYKFDLETGYTYSIAAPLVSVGGSCNPADPRMMWSCASPLTTAFHVAHDGKQYVLNTAYQADGVSSYQRSVRYPTREDPMYRFSYSTTFNQYNDCAGDYNMTVGLGKDKDYEVLIERALYEPCTLGYSGTIVKFKPQFCDCKYVGKDNGR